MNSVKVNWTADSLTPSSCVSGTVKSVHAYWRLALAIMAPTPAVSRHHRLATEALSLADWATAMEFPPVVAECRCRDRQLNGSTAVPGSAQAEDRRASRVCALDDC